MSKSWKTWAKNFPLKSTYRPADGVFPEGIEIRRAGKSIFISTEELDEIMALAAIIMSEEEA